MGYAIDGFEQTQELQGGNQLVLVREFHCRSLPSDTYFAFRRPKAKWGAANIKSVAQQLSDRIEAVLGLADVTGVAYSQNVNDAGRLLDWMTTYYATEDGSIRGSVESDLAHFGPNYTGQQVETEIAQGGDFLVA